MKNGSFQDNDQGRFIIERTLLQACKRSATACQIADLVGYSTVQSIAEETGSGQRIVSESELTFESTLLYQELCVLYLPSFVSMLSRTPTQ